MGAAAAGDKSSMMHRMILIRVVQYPIQSVPGVLVDPEDPAIRTMAAMVGTLRSEPCRRKVADTEELDIRELRREAPRPMEVGPVATSPMDLLLLHQMETLPIRVETATVVTSTLPALVAVVVLEIQA